MFQKALAFAVAIAMAIGLITPVGAATDATSNEIAVPDGPGWVTVLVEPENNTPVRVRADVQVKHMYALYAFDYYPTVAESKLQVGGALVTNTNGTRVRIVNDGEEWMDERPQGEPDQGPRTYHFSYESDPYYPHAFVFFAAGTVLQFDVHVVSGRILYASYGPEAWALWPSQDDSQESDTRIYAAYSIFGEDLNTQSYPVSFWAPRGIMGEFGGGLVVDPATLDTPLGTQTCTCYPKPDESIAGLYTYTPPRIRADTIAFWAFAPELPYI